jgi:hypothetical protein
MDTLAWICFVVMIVVAVISVWFVYRLFDWMFWNAKWHNRLTKMYCALMALVSSMFIGLVAAFVILIFCTAISVMIKILF